MLQVQQFEKYKLKHSFWNGKILVTLSIYISIQWQTSDMKHSFSPIDPTETSRLSNLKSSNN